MKLGFDLLFSCTLVGNYGCCSHIYEGSGRRKDMTEEFSELVFETLLARSKIGKLGKKDVAEVAKQFGISLRSTKKLWKKGKIHLGQGIPSNVASREGVGLAVRKLQLI
jgi:hypothetical protein